MYSLSTPKEITPTAALRAAKREILVLVLISLFLGEIRTTQGSCRERGKPIAAREVNYPSDQEANTAADPQHTHSTPHPPVSTLELFEILILPAL